MVKGMDHRQDLIVEEEDETETPTHALPVDLVSVLEKAVVEVATEGESIRSV
jgi:hypothetical protein